MSIPTKLLATFIMCAALTAMCVSGYLAWSAWGTGQVAGCNADASFDCEDVLASQWATWFGIPVAACGAIVYLGIAALVWPASSSPRGITMCLLATLNLMALGSALWFVGLQVFQLQSFCAYCLAVHSCALLIAVATIALFFVGLSDLQTIRPAAVVRSPMVGVPSLVSSRQDSISSQTAIAIMSLGPIGVAALIGSQILAPGSESMALQEIELKPVQRQAPLQVSDESPIAPDFMDNAPTNSDEAKSSNRPPGRLLNFTALSQPLDVNDSPIIGDPEAQHVIVEMLDYTCSHCRQLHPRLMAAHQRYGDDLAIALYHAPLNRECNDHMPRGRKGRRDACEYARLALAVWELAPDQFADYHNWLMNGRAVPSIGQARQRAMRLVGDQVLLNNTTRDKNTERLRAQCDNWNEIAKSLPVLVFPNSAVVGGGKSNEELFAMLEQKLGLEAKDLQDD